MRRARDTHTYKGRERKELFILHLFSLHRIFPYSETQYSHTTEMLRETCSRVVKSGARGEVKEGGVDSGDNRKRAERGKRKEGGRLVEGALHICMHKAGTTAPPW